MNVPTHGDTGYIVECDLKYPEKLHELHSDYPMAPEHLTVSPDMLTISAANLKTKIGYPLQSSSPTYLTKPNTFSITEIFNFTSNTASF